MPFEPEVLKVIMNYFVWLISVLKMVDDSKNKLPSNGKCKKGLIKAITEGIYKHVSKCK